MSRPTSKASSLLRGETGENPLKVDRVDNQEEPDSTLSSNDFALSRGRATYVLMLKRARASSAAAAAATAATTADGDGDFNPDSPPVEDAEGARFLKNRGLIAATEAHSMAVLISTNDQVLIGAASVIG